MIARRVTSHIWQSLEDSPVVFLNGARQTGKTTLVRSISSDYCHSRYFTFDDLSILSAAKNDPSGFISELKLPVIIDEVQRVPDIFLSIKERIDRDRHPGQFLLTGSANIMLLPKLANYMAGRMQIIRLWPFAQSEIDQTECNLPDALFDGNFRNITPAPTSVGNLFNRILTGGFPEMQTRKSQTSRDNWFESYLHTIVQRDIRDFSTITGITEIPRLISLLASRTANLLNYSDLSRTLSIPNSTLKRYFALLQACFLIQLIPSWSKNIGKRAVRSPKIIITDTGLISYLLAVDKERLEKNLEMRGPLLENFVVMELIKQISWSRTRPEIFHYRSRDGKEIDIILEDRQGRIAGIEVKSASTVKSDDFKGIRFLKEAVGGELVSGIVFYTGDKIIPFGSNLYAIPVSSLWNR